MSNFFSSFAAIDFVTLLILALFILLGFIKGFTWQVMRIATIVAGMLLAKAFASSVASLLANMFSDLEDSDYALYVSYFVIFIIVFIFGTVVAIFLGKAVKKLQLRLYDRVLGGIVGFLTGWTAIVLLVLFLMSVSTQGSLKEEVKTSKTAECAAWTCAKLRPLIPPELRAKIGKTARKGYIEIRGTPPAKEKPVKEPAKEGTPPPEMGR